ncbi:hypothetical protein KIL84_015516 [Mauremys mutica]|uniref:Uncharacterized protein n=1 Tax=Mauremys mutica TaxID=74926 RepID=A0A9D3WMF7_9SAUR|nr:hypothetical protein KIL84_015516 [Mauremys mutica]
MCELGQTTATGFVLRSGQFWPWDLPGKGLSQDSPGAAGREQTLLPTLCCAAPGSAPGAGCSIRTGLYRLCPQEGGQSPSNPHPLSASCPLLQERHLPPPSLAPLQCHPVLLPPPEGEWALPSQSPPPGSNLPQRSRQMG